jgi:hypothetical protein
MDSRVASDPILDWILAVEANEVPRTVAGLETPWDFEGDTD